MLEILTKKVANRINDIVNNAAGVLYREMVLNVPEFTGTLRKSLRKAPSRVGNVYRISVESSKYYTYTQDIEPHYHMPGITGGKEKRILQSSAWLAHKSTLKAKQRVFLSLQLQYKAAYSYLKRIGALRLYPVNFSHKALLTTKNYVLSEIRKGLL